jgi:hypothetical protein
MKHLFLAAAAVALALGFAPAVVAQDHSHHAAPAATSGAVGVPVMAGQPVTYGQPVAVGQPVVLTRAVVGGKGCGCSPRQPAFSTVVGYPQYTTYSPPALGTATGGVTYAPASGTVVGYPVATTAPQTWAVAQPQVSALPTAATGASATPHCSKCASGK